jgi:hypothetical protein
MACKCQDNKTKADKPCKDPVDESYRDAYKRLNKNFIQASAHVKELQAQLQATESKTKEYLEALCQRLQALESYSENAVKVMDPYTRNKFISKFGQPPHSPQIA